MNPLQMLCLVLVGLAGTAVVFVREPLPQILVSGLFGLTLTMFFLAFQAPEVALSQLAVGSLAQPMLLLITLAKIQRGEKA